MKQLSLRSFLVLRVIAFVGILCALALGHFVLRLSFVSSFSWFLAAMYGLTNVLLFFLKSRQSDRSSERVILGFLLFDLGFLTVLLILNGGSQNPFSILFISLASIAAMTLRRWFYVGIVALSLVAIGLIYSGWFEDIPLHHHGSHDLMLHLRGMWAANALGVCVGSGWVYWMKIRQSALEQKQREAERVLAHLARLESVGKMVARTAHQLNTPLGTLQLVCSELKTPQLFEDRATYEAWLVDFQSALDRIQEILQDMQGSPVRTDPSQRTDLADILSAAVAEWASPRGIVVELTLEKNILILSTQMNEWVSCLYVLLDNAWDALQESTKASIQVRLQTQGPQLFLEVCDSGVGMNVSELQRIGEPFFTTKRDGTGVGLYFCQQFAEKLGGSLQIDSQPGQGTRVELRFDLQLL